ncbi:MAG: hypothetical protein V1922_05815 [bacterium]
MKIFFTASQRGKKQFGEAYKKIRSYIQDHKYILLDDDIFTEEPTQLYKALESGNHEVQVDFYHKKINTIKEADICIFEVSTHSLSVGFVIQKALEFNKPIIILYMKGYVPHFFTGVENDKMILKEYEGGSLEKKLQEALKEALDLREKRFNFFISPNLLAYLESASKHEGITKSLFIRNLILAHKKKHV